MGPLVAGQSILDELGNRLAFETARPSRPIV